jgi:threonine/homoserine/homoserine lactone efflux protein
LARTDGRGFVKIVLAEILPLALVVAISPINIIPVILLLFTKRPLVNSSSFLAGFLVGVGGVLVACVAMAEAVDLSASSGHSTWVAWLKLILGTYLLVAAVRKFRGRPRAGEVGAMPKWMDGMATFGPGKSMTAGLALGAANPKNVVMGLAAAASIASFALPKDQLAAAIAIYVSVSALGLAVPILTTIWLGARSRGILDGWKIWLNQNNATVMSVLFLVFGVVLVAQAIGAS